MIKLLHKHIVILTLFFFCISYAQEVSTDEMLIKKGHIIQSAANGKSYQLYISLPSGYSANDAVRYPVLYLLDGNLTYPLAVTIHNLMDSSGEIEKVIIVAIGDLDQSAKTWLVNRTFDYTPSNDPIANKDIAAGLNVPESSIKSGGAGAFIKTLRNDIIPFIEKQYKTTGDCGIAGHSLGGLLSAHCLVNEPGMFNRYGISSPSLFWNDSKILSEENHFSEGHKSLKAKVFISIGGSEPEILKASFNAFTSALKEHKYKDLVLTTEIFEKETHTSVLAAAFTRMLKTLYGK